jgi:uncharacterized RDD family membrane protein YckC
MTDETATFAGFWARFGAHWIDFILWNAVEFGLEWGITNLLGLSGLGEQIVGVVLTLVMVYLYYVEVPVRTGTTLGKRALRIYVLDRKTGLPIGRKQAAIRTASYLLSYAIVGSGFTMVLFHPQKLGLHDLIAGTVSIRRKKRASP